MPYPTAYALLGAGAAKKSDVPLFLAVFFAILPDVDFLFGIFNPNLIKNPGNNVELLHTIWFPFAGALLFVLICKLLHIRYTIKSILVIFLLVALHILMDIFVIPLPYRLGAVGGGGFMDFFDTYIFNPDFIWNNLIDVIFYGVLYVVVVKFIFHLPLSPFAKKKKK